MKPNIEEKKSAESVLASLSRTDRSEVIRWSFIYELCGRNLPGCAVVDDSTEALLEVVRKAAIQRIARYCRWSMLAGEAGVGDARLSRRVYCLVCVVTMLGEEDASQSSFGVFDENAQLTRPQGVVEDLRATYLENSGIDA